MTDLHRDFERLRHEDESLIPEFDAVLTAGPVGQGSRRRIAALATAAVVVVTGVWLAEQSRSGTSGGGLAAALTSESDIGWVSPTDYLLELPGAELMRGVPLLETTPGIDTTIPQQSEPAPDSARNGRKRT